MRRNSTRRAKRGFTLLEIMVALAILTFVTSTVIALFWDSVSSTNTAVDKRRVREAADSLFRRILYERDKWKDGDSGSLAIEYAEWTKFSQAEIDDWRDFRWELKKTPQLAAGTSDDGEVESVFGEDEVDDDDDETEEGEEEGGNVQLMRVILKIYDIEKGESEPLVTLATYQPHEAESTNK